MVRTSLNSSNKLVSRNRSHLRTLFRQMLVEGLERREMMAADTGPRLLSISTNVGTVLDPTATGVTANVIRESPNEIVFRFDGSQSIDLSPASLAGIRIQREGNLDQDFATGSPITVSPAYLGYGESERIVIARFSEPLPDDLYRIQVFGSGSPTPLLNRLGEALRPAAGTQDTYFMNLELGAKILAVVPQPTRVAGTPGVNSARNQIEVYFNDDDLNVASAQNPAYYQLIRTNDSVIPSDDVVVNPSVVTYDAALNKAVLTFNGANDLLSVGSATFRLRIGSSQSGVRSVPIVTPLGPDVGDTLATAASTIGVLTGDVSRIINEQVVSTPSNQLGLDFPGSESDPGNRDIQDERAVLGTADINPSTTTRYYSFLINQPYGIDGQGRPVTTAISELQKQRVREVFEFYSHFLGIQFIEATGLTAPDGSPTLQVVVGDLLSDIIGVSGGPGSYVTNTQLDLNNQVSLAILDGSELWDNDFGYGTQRDNLINDSIDPTRLTNPLMGEALRSQLFVQTLTQPLDVVGPNFFIEAMRVIGSLIGLGQTHDLPPGTIQGYEPLLGRVENPLEQIFPGDQDIARGQFLYRPDNRDVDVYRFTIPTGEKGTIVLQATAEGLADSSSLDTYLKLYRRNIGTGEVTLLSSNDNYVSNDSLIRLDVEGIANVEYFVAVTSKGNETFDPAVRGSGSGGLSDGRYQLRVDYRQSPVAATAIADTSGAAIDGDGNGRSGGEFNYWFRTADPINTAPVGAPRTIYVDKNATVAGNGVGSLADPYKKIQDAFSIALPGDIVRVLGSDPSTSLTSRRAYEIGDGGPSKPILDDGRDLIVPKGVSLMIDAGAIFKLASAQVLVGSDAATSDRSGATIQVLGVPTNNVYFTSYNDESLGVDTNSLPTTAQRGSWGGIEIRNDVDREQGRVDPELSGIFLNYVAMADMRFGGGSIGQGSLSRVVDPIHLNSARPTILHNRISQSADAGISADPTSFEETLFTEARYQFTGVFTPDYTRVGPVIRGNRITDSSMNGLLIRVDTLPGQRLETLDVAARLDDTDIVYVLGETLTINGTPGGAILEEVRPDLTRVAFAPIAGGSLAAGTSYSYVLRYVDKFGQEGLPSQPITRTASSGSTRLSSLPSATGDFIGRRLYRSSTTNPGTWDLVAELDKSTVSFTDTGRTLARSITITSAATLNRSRYDASLVVDPGVVIKSQGARIEVGISAQLIAEGTSNKPIVFTSRADDRFGAGATFDTNNDQTSSVGQAGDWSGILGLHLSTVSIDSTVITFGGGASRVAGGFGSFNAIELHQSEARIANSLIENNASGAGTATTTRRAARGVNDAAAIYVSGSQPIIVNNVIRNNSVTVAGLLSQTFQNGETAAISIDANSLKAVSKLDYGRSVGLAEVFDAGKGNQGPLVSGNRLGENAINGMRVRGATLTTESVWDDTDIVHVLQKEIVVPDFSTYGGLRLQSRGDESLVVKLSGPTAGFTATGRAIGITDRIGGSLQIVGSPGFPVVLTDLADDKIGAGFDSFGKSMTDTNNDGAATTSVKGSWRGILLDAYGNDRNVETTYEYEPDLLGANGTNNLTTSAQDIGSLAKDIESGDENVRLGITLSGAIARSNDVDVYRFTATTGTMVWFDIDRTSGNLDTVLELVDANGRIIALSNNSLDESLTGNVTYYDPNVITDDRIYPMDQSIFSARNANAPGAQVDFQGVNPLDAGFRVALPGTPGTTNDYFIRVRSSNVSDSTLPGASATLTDTALVNRGITSGAYRLQLRLQQLDEVGGSTIRYSDIRFANRAIDVQGGPIHSPLLGELGQPTLLETETDSTFVAGSGNIQIGNIFNYDRGAVSIAAALTGQTDVDWYSFTVNRELASNLDSLKHQAVSFDIDYADALGRPDTSLWVFEANAAGAPQRLILLGRDSDITDDKASPNQGTNANDITRGSFGSGDAFIGSSELPTGNYVVAVTSNSRTASVIGQYISADYNDPLVRLEPLDSIRRISEDRFGVNQASPLAPPVQEAFPNAPLGTAANVYPNAVPFTLADVTAFVARDNPAGGAPRSQLLLANAQTAAKEAEGGTRANGGIFDLRIRDIAASPAGILVGPAFEPTAGRIEDGNTGFFARMDADGSVLTPTNALIDTIEIVQTGPTAFTSGPVRQGNAQVGIGMTFTSITFGDDPNNALTMFGVAQRGAGGNINQPFDEAVIALVNNAATTIAISPNTGIFRNILYRLDPLDQEALSPTTAGLGDRGGASQATGTGTDKREYGIFADIDANATHYVRRANGLADTIIVRQHANGNIVGIAEAGNFLYGVTDAGELWRMNQTSFTNGFRGAELIATNVPTGLTGLSLGPRNLAIDAPKSEFILNTSKRIDAGSFQLTFDGQTTIRLPYNASALDIQTALESLSTVGVGNVRVTGGSGIGNGLLSESPIAISLVGTLTGSALPVTLAPGNTLRTTPVASISRPDAAQSFFRLKIPTEATGGNYQLKYDSFAAGNSDGPIIFPYNATAAQIQAAILSLPSIVNANNVVVTPPALPPIVVTVRQTAAGVFDIQFSGSAVPGGITLNLEPITTLVQNSPVSYSIVTIAPSAQPTYYQLQYGTDPKISFSSNDTTAIIEAKILSSLSIAAANAAIPGSITVTVTEPVPGFGVYDVVFGGTALPATISLQLTESLFSSLPSPAPTITTQSISRYSSMLFGVTSNGTMHAFDLNGLPQHIFTGGQSSIITGQTANGFNDSLSVVGPTGVDVQGIDFSILDVNLWQVTSDRTNDAGHGTLQNFNQSRINSANAGNSLYFGLSANNATTGRQAGIWSGIYDLAGQTGAINQTYAVPGGAKGALESNPIDLSGYSPDDQPTLYFNYNLDTQNSNSPLTDNASMLDAFRVYGYGPNGTWILLGTNNSANNNNTNVLGQFTEIRDEYDVPVSGYQDGLGRSYRTQELFDRAAGATTWRQARINLAPLAGMQDARIRFEFSTSGDFRTGDPLRAGIELAAISGDRIKSGDGFSIVAPTVDPFNPPSPIAFLFDVDGTLTGPNVIPVNNTMDAVAVRDAVRLALARVLNGDAEGNENVIPYPVYQNTVRIYNYQVANSGPLHATVNRGADKFAAYTGVLSTGVLGDLQGTKDFQRAFQMTQNNAFEGVYIDDIIIGFAERGEQVLLPPTIDSTTAFVATPFYEHIGGAGGLPTTQTEAGAYQLEIRTSADYGDQGSARLVLERTFDTNERMSNQVAMLVSETIAVVDGDTFTIDDGYSRVTFEFDIRTALSDPSSVSQGNIPVPLVLPFFSPEANAGLVATAIRDAINSPAGQSSLRITAGLRGQILSATRTDLQRDSSNVVELFTRDGSLPISSITTQTSPLSPFGAAGPNALSNVFGPNPIDPFGVFPNLYPPVLIAGINVYGREAKFDVLPFGEDLGDSNRYRDQGQIVISANTISDSADFGIIVDAASTGFSANNPNGRQLPGVVRNLPTLNNENLTPGVVIVNNLIIRSDTGGIQLSGGGGASQAGTPSFSVARVINNTIYGGSAVNAVPTGVGIQVDQGASPTLINNIIASNNVGISAGSLNVSGGNSTISGGNLFSENNTSTTPASLVGTFDIFLLPGETLFNDLTNDKFYLSSRSRAIDSSLGSLIERPGLSSVKSGIGRQPNPMIAPDRDLVGVLRRDDTNVNTPVGQGQNVFIDRGAVDRSDFAGPIATLTRPLDNSIQAGDTNPAVSLVRLANGTPSIDYFEILLDESQGTGVDPSTVIATSVLLTENGRLLIEGLDYVFGYSANSRTIRLTPLSGVWRDDSAYEITLNNRPRLLVNSPDGLAAADGTQLVATTANGTEVTFEYDTGVVIQIPPEGSTPGGLQSGDTFTISYNSASVQFELTTGGPTAPNSQPVLIPTNASSSAVRDAILAVLISPTASIQALNLKPTAVDSDKIQLGAIGDGRLTTTIPNLTVTGNTGVSSSLQLQMPTDGTFVIDGQTFTVTTATGTATFEFRKTGGGTAGNRLILVNDIDSSSVIATKVLNSVNAAGLGIVPTFVNSNTVSLNESIGTRFNIGTAPFVVSGVAGGAIAIPVVPSTTFSSDVVSGLLLTAMNGLPKPQFQSVRALGIGGSLQVDGLQSITNITSSAIPAIVDFAGNFLNENRSNGYTQFTISMPNSGLDFGDAPFQTLSINDGPNHVLYPTDVPPLRLGATVNSELDGQPSALSNLDIGDDGVTFLGQFNSNSPAASISVSVQGTGYLDAWIDWNGNNLFEANEKVIDSQPVVTGSNTFSIATPAAAIAGSSSARFRLSSTGGLMPTGLVVGGEVEDYQVTVYPGSPPIANADSSGVNPPYSMMEDSGNLVVSATGVLSNDTDPDFGQTLTAQLLNGPTNGTLLSFNSNGSFTYRPNLHFAGSDTFTYYAIDPSGLRSVLPATVTITVNEVNDLPEFSLPSLVVSLNEDETNSVGPVDHYSVAGFATNILPGPASATSESSQILSFNIAVAPNQRSFFSALPTISSTGLLTFKLAPDVNRLFPNGANIPIVATLTDNGNPNATSLPRTFTIDIAPVNDNPVANGNSFSTYEDSPITPTEASLLARDFAGPATALDEIANQPLSIVGFQSTTSGGGSVTRLLPNSFNYRPAPNFVGLDFFTYTISDGVSGSQTSTGTITITVLEVNDAPAFTIANSTIDVLEDQGSLIDAQGVQSQVPISIPGFATNVRPGPLTAVDEVNQVLTFTVVALNPSFYQDQPTIVRSTSDPSQAILTFTLKPHLNRDTPAGSINNITVTVSDDGPRQPGILPPNPSARPADVFTSQSQTFSINIIPVNDPPIPAAPTIPFVVAEDGLLNLSRLQVLQPSLANTARPGPAVATDEVSQVLSITRIDGVSAMGGTLSAVLDASGGFSSIQYRPANNYVGPDSFTYTVTDNGGGSTDATVGTVSINVTPINDAPVIISGGNITVLEDSAPYSAPWAGGISAGPPSAVDELNGNVSLSIPAQTLSSLQVTTTTPQFFLSGPSISLAGVLSFQLAPNINGDAIVSVTATDSGSNVAPNVNTSAPVSFTISVTAVNDAPVFTAGGNITVDEDSGAYSQTWATGILEAAGLGLSPQQSLDEDTQSVSFVTTNSNDALFSVPPAIDSNGILTFTTALNANGSAVVTVFARDSGSEIAPNVRDSQPVTFTITLDPVNDRPVGVTDNYSTTEDTRIISTAGQELSANDFDIDGDSFLVVAETTTSQLGAVVILNADGSFTYDPRDAASIQAFQNGQVLNDTFTYLLRDSNGDESLPVTVTISVTGINDAPNTGNDTLPIVFNQATILDVLANDVDVDSVINRSSLEIGIVPTNGRLTVLNNGTVSYVPNTGYRGNDSFTYRVRDDFGTFSRETAVQLVMNNAPIANADTASTVRGTAVTIDVVANDRDPDVGDTIVRSSVAIVSQSSGGNAVVLANGNIQFTPNSSFTGLTTFTYTVADNNGLRSQIGTVSVQVVQSLYQNPLNSADVNNDGFVSPIDALIVINHLNTRPQPPLSTTLPPYYLDVDGNNIVTPNDILQVINFINTRGNNIGGEGEAGTSVLVTPQITSSLPVPSQSSTSQSVPLQSSIDVEVLDQRSVRSYVQNRTLSVNSGSVAPLTANRIVDLILADEIDAPPGLQSVAVGVQENQRLRASNKTFDSAFSGDWNDLGVD